MKVAILYPRVINLDGSALSIGGIQNYLLSLAELCLDNGWEPAIIQLGNRDFACVQGKIKVYAYATSLKIDNFIEVGRFLSERATEWLGGNKGIIIFGTDLISTKTDNILSIVIQHGVMNDLKPIAVPPVGAGKIRAIMKKMIGGTKAYRLYNSYQNSICNDAIYRGIECADTAVFVDYNFYNTYKILRRDGLNGALIAIPNFAHPATLAEFNTKKYADTIVNVIFARRFEWYRGTRMIAPVVKRLIEYHENVYFTFAGEGPDEIWLKQYFSGIPRVKFITYAYSDSTKVFLQHQIAVVPSIGSEGTSLAALEAMGAGCAVVATCVGGLTNVIMDNYNGKLVMPDENELYEAISSLVQNPDQMQRIAKNAYETVTQSFSKEIWRTKWLKLLSDLMAKHFT